jgi:superfamily I DNA/RNA helicase
MKFTDEQEAVFESSGDIKINAVAGSGKTTVLVEYAKRKPRSRILYLAFNRSVRMEAKQRFISEGISNVDVQTAHSLAFGRIVAPLGYKIASGYRIHEITGILNLKPSGKDLLSSFLIAHHILKFSAMFCNGTARKVNEIDYCATVTDPQSRSAARHYYDQIEKGARLFLAKMDKKEIAATHDFYLKKFQLSQPKLNYDYILFDEGQDASAVMLDVFLAQTATKVIVGDMYQQIYGWRYAVNALKSVRFTQYKLTISFRFNDHIAGLAMECLGWKKHIGENVELCIKGAGTNKKIKTCATIARSNLALLKNAIDAVQHDRSIKKLYFEGNIKSYTYAAEGASIYDVLNLYQDKTEYIRDPMIASMASFKQLTEYAETSEDMELKMLVDVVNAYGVKIPGLLKKLTEMHVTDDKREQADMIFSTLHRCKGMEYDSVILTEDFINEDRIKKLLHNDKQYIDTAKISEEINLVYVAVTRSKNFLNFPDYMFPNADKDNFTKAKIPVQLPKKRNKIAKGNFSLPERQKQFPRAYSLWSADEDDKLRKMYLVKCMSVPEIAKKLDRNAGAIRARLNKMGIEV